MSEFYEKYWHQRGKSGSRPRYGILSDWIEINSRVLDIGCGDGYFGEMLLCGKKVSYLGCDISEAALKEAESRGLETKLLDAETNLSFFGDKSFDFVIMSEFLEHVADSERILKEAGRIARRGVLVTIPNIAYWKFRLELLFGRFPKQWAFSPREHLRYWSVSDFIKTVNDLGFKVSKMKSSNGRKGLRDWWPNLFGLQVCFFITK